MAGGTEAFPDLGAHCAEEDCHQLDFLPFKCDSCLKVYCLEHRSYKAHGCSKGDIKDKIVLICPTCEGTIKKVYGESEELTLKKHSENGSCLRPTRKPRCPVKGCREQLRFSNTYHCKSCGSDTCLRHRFAADHACKERNYSKLIGALAKRGAQDCGTSASATLSNPKGIKTLKDLSHHLNNVRLQVF